MFVRFVPGPSPADDMRNAAVDARRVLEWVACWPSVDLSRLDRLREVIKYLRWAVYRFDTQETMTMHFTISASGSNKQDTLEQLERQREDSPDYTSLKNQVLEHIAGHVQAAPEGSTAFSVSLSAHVSFTKPVTDGSEPG